MLVMMGLTVAPAGGGDMSAEDGSINGVTTLSCEMWDWSKKETAYGIVPGLI